MEVGFFIVGAPKAGTSSIYELLKNHPDVCMSKVKEPNYFSQKEISSLYKTSDYRSGLLEFESISQYHDLYKDANKLCGEASVSYLMYPDVAQRIKKYNPDSKIIICLRDPVERAISHYRMDRRLGFTSKSLGDIVLEASDELSVEYFQYIQGSIYSNQIDRYFDAFHEKQLMIIEFNELLDNPEFVAKEIQVFLELPVKLNSIPHENSGFDTTNPILSSLYKSKVFRDTVKHLVSKNAVIKIKKIMNTGKGERVENDVKKRIYQLMQHDISNVESLVGKKFAHWTRYDS